MVNLFRRVLRTGIPLVVLGFCHSVLSADEATGTVNLELAGLAKADGSVFIAVFDSSDTWLSEDTFAGREVVITDALEGDLVLVQLQLPPGEYALSIFYDRNGNGEMDTNFIGIPKEPIAMSNNAKMKFGPPKYDDAVFTLSDQPLTQRIQFKEL